MAKDDGTAWRSLEADLRAEDPGFARRFHRSSVRLATAARAADPITAIAVPIAAWTVAAPVLVIFGMSASPGSLVLGATVASTWSMTLKLARSIIDQRSAGRLQ